MQIKEELRAMADRLFSDGMVDSILAAHEQEIKEDGWKDLEQAYRSGIEALHTCLDAAQEAELSALEILYDENMHYALRFGYTRGVYVGFQQFFVRDVTERPFREYITDKLLTMPNMRQYKDYYQRNGQINAILEALREPLSEADVEHLANVEEAWDERIYSILRYSFYLGYRSALAILEDVGPYGVTLQMVGKVLLTEHELDFTNTWEEREMWQELLDRPGKTPGQDTEPDE